MVEFSNRVLTFTSLGGSVFDRPLYEQSNLRDFREELYEDYSWVEKGENLEVLRVKPSRSQSPAPIYIRSPVAGLVINPRIFDGYGKILLPKGEEIPADAGEIIYGELCRFCENNEQFLFGELKVRRTLAEEIRKLRDFANSYVIKPLDIVHLEAVRYYQPHIAPAIEEMFAEEKRSKENRSKQQVQSEAPASPAPQVQAGKIKTDNVKQRVIPENIDAIRIKWELPENFTEDQLEDKFLARAVNCITERMKVRNESEFVQLQPYAVAA